jgi:hypothetical protein
LSGLQFSFQLLTPTLFSFQEKRKDGLPSPAFDTHAIRDPTEGGKKGQMEPGTEQLGARGNAHLAAHLCLSVIQPIRVHSCLSAVKKTVFSGFLRFLRFFAPPRVPHLSPPSDLRPPTSVPRSAFRVPRSSRAQSCSVVPDRT